MTTEALPLQALKQAITGAKETSGLIHHSDHGSQYVSIVYNDRLTDAGITPSTGRVGDSYDNALAENVNRTKSFTPATGPVEIATFEWANWSNTKQLHQALDYRTPAEIETDYRQQHQLSATIEIRVNT